jgi:hypothetical protein
MKSNELIASIVDELQTLDLNSRVACNQLDRIAARVYKASNLLSEEQYQASVAAYESRVSN